MRSAVVSIIIITLFSSCSGNRESTLANAKITTEKYYRLYKTNRNDSMKSISSNNVIEHINELVGNLHSEFGQIVANTYVEGKQISEFGTSGNSKTFLIIYKVAYDSGVWTKETFKFIDSTNKIYSIEIVEWKEN